MTQVVREEAAPAASFSFPAGWPAMSIAEAHARLIAPGRRFETEELVIRGIPTMLRRPLSCVCAQHPRRFA